MWRDRPAAYFSVERMAVGRRLSQCQAHWAATIAHFSRWASRTIETV